MPPFKLNNKHGGSRIGSGRPPGTGSYGEPTEVVRVPISKLGAVTRLINTTRHPHALTELRVTESRAPALSPLQQRFPVMGARIPAGFPSPADDYLERRIDLNEHLIIHKEATFFLRVAGFSMIQAGIHDGDVLVVDRALEPVHNKIVIAIVNGDLTVKRLYRQDGKVMLLAENPDFAPIEFADGDEMTIWGVVTCVLHSL